MKNLKFAIYAVMLLFIQAPLHAQFNDGDVVAFLSDIVAIHESNKNQAYAQWIVVVIKD